MQICIIGLKMTNRLTTSKMSPDMLLSRPVDMRRKKILGKSVEGRRDLDRANAWIIPTSARVRSTWDARSNIEVHGIRTVLGWKWIDGEWVLILIPMKKASNFEVTITFAFLGILPPLYFSDILSDYRFKLNENNPDKCSSLEYKACLYMHLSIEYNSIHS